MEKQFTDKLNSMHIFPSIPESSFDAYIFDCDGTLADSSIMHFDSWIYALTKHDAQFEFTWPMFRSMAGMGLIHTVEHMNKKFEHALDPYAVVEDIKVYVKENAHRVEPIESVIQIAHKLSKNYPTSVASGGPREIVHQTLRTIKAYDIFHHIVTQDDVTNCKPHPEIFLYAAEKMGIKPEKCLVFEDSPLGIEAAQKAGMIPVLVKCTENIKSYT